MPKRGRSESDLLTVLNWSKPLDNSGFVNMRIEANLLSLTGDNG